MGQENNHGEILSSWALAFMSPIAPVPSGPPPVASANTLTELRRHVSVIHASSLFHLFNEEKQFELGKRLAALLDPRPGSIISGSQRGMPVKGQRHGIFQKTFCHSPESRTQMWGEQIFGKNQIKDNTIFGGMNMAAGKLERAAPVEERAKNYSHAWSVDRL